MEREDTSENFDNTEAILQFWPKMAILCRGKDSRMLWEAKPTTLAMQEL
jgi:hypothetical protein